MEAVKTVMVPACKPAKKEKSLQDGGWAMDQAETG
jgi:hypothetical protein